MDKFVWNDEYVIGHSLIDHQHRSMVMMVNELIELSESADPDEVVYLDILVRLNEYVQTHFQAEEALMEHIGYPHIKAHKESHSSLFTQASKFITTPDINQLEEVMQFLGEWLTEHIMYEDMKFKPYLNN